MDVRRIAGALGAELHGIDLAETLSAHAVAAIRDAFLKHQVIFFRGQNLTLEQFMAFARAMGRPVPYPFVKGIEGFPEVIEVKKLEHERHNFGGIWHSDTAYLDELVGVNSSAKADVTRTREDMVKEYSKHYEAEHPVVRTHPETGRKALYVNRGHTVRFRGMTEQESASLLEFLFRHQVRPEFTCRFQWQVGSLAFWDKPR